MRVGKKRGCKGLGTEQAFCTKMPTCISNKYEVGWGVRGDGGTATYQQVPAGSATSGFEGLWVNQSTVKSNTRSGVLCRDSWICTSVTGGQIRNGEEFGVHTQRMLAGLTP